MECLHEITQYDGPNPAPWVVIVGVVGVAAAMLRLVVVVVIILERFGKSPGEASGCQKFAVEEAAAT